MQKKSKWKSSKRDNNVADDLKKKKIKNKTKIVKKKTIFSILTWLTSVE